MKDIWVFVEVNRNEIANVSLELLNEAVRIKNKMRDPGKVVGIIIGKDVEKLSKTCMEYGAEKVLIADDPRLKLYNPEYYSAIFAKIIREYKPHILLFGATFIGSQLAPTVAAKIKTGVAAHSIGIKIDEYDNMMAVVPAFGGKVLGNIMIPNHSPQIASIKAGIMDKPRKIYANGEVEILDLEFMEDIEVKLKPINSCMKEQKGIPLDEAEIVLCGGYGLGEKEHWDTLIKLANRLGGSVGCTRPVVDEGWTEDDSCMIGTSGKSIRPKIYIGFGISGSTHHICGMKDAQLIININSDENSEVFNISDYGLVGNVKEILPLLAKTFNIK